MLFYTFDVKYMLTVEAGMANRGFWRELLGGICILCYEAPEVQRPLRLERIKLIWNNR